MFFEIRIELANEAMLNVTEVSNALAAVSQKLIRDGADYGPVPTDFDTRILDANGNTVGTARVVQFASLEAPRLAKGDER